MPRQIEITNAKSIGDEFNPVEQLFVKRILKVENISYSLPNYTGTDTETYKGITIDKTTNAVESLEGFKCSGTLTLGGHVVAGTWNISAAGGNVGLGFSGPDAIFSDKVTASGIIVADGGIRLNGNIISNDGGLKGIRILDTTGHVEVYSLSTIDGGAITSQGNVRTFGVFKVAGDEGLNTTVDFSTYTGILTFAGGILINKSAG